MSKNNFTLSLIIPVYNEQSNLRWMHQRIKEFEASKSFKVEVLFVNDGSTDDSLSEIKEIASQNTNVKYISFSRNFGKEAATTAGLNKCSGDVAVMVDADGQHPLNVIDEFLDKWRQGYEVVIGVRSANSKEGFVKKYGSKVFNLLLNSLTGGNTIRNSTDFRLLDRKVINEFNRLTEHNRVTRGLIDWLGFRRSFVNFEAPARHSGEAAYSIKKLVKLAVHAFVSQSTKPLQFTGFLGALVMFLSAFVTIFLLIEKYILGDPLNLNVTGSAILAIFLSFLIGMVLICQWLLALYIESIHNETQNRPLYVVGEEN